MAENATHPGSSLQVREDIAQNFSDLFGDKKVNGQTVNIEDLIAELATDFQDDFAQVLKARGGFLKQPGDARTKYAFLPSDLTVLALQPFQTGTSSQKTESVEARISWACRGEREAIKVSSL